VSSIANADRPSLNLAAAHHCIGAMSVQADAVTKHALRNGMLVRADPKKAMECSCRTSLAFAVAVSEEYSFGPITSVLAALSWMLLSSSAEEGQRLGPPSPATSLLLGSSKKVGPGPEQATSTTGERYAGHRP
jgi:hypothetical protein